MSSIVLENDVNRIINSFIPGNNHLYISTICKEWTPSLNTNTSFLNVTTSLSRIEEFFESGGIINWALFEEAIKYGDISILKKIIDVDKSMDDSFLYRDKHRCSIYTFACYIALHANKIKVLKWLFSKGFPLNGHVICELASTGDLELLKWCRENGCKWSDFFCYIALEHKQVDILKYAIENGCEWGTCGWTEVSSIGDLELFKWCIKKGCLCKYYTCSESVSQGHLEIAEFCRKNGCPESNNSPGYFLWCFNRDHMM